MDAYDVVVVGAGPAGLFAAAEIARGGRSVAVLDRRHEPSRLSRAFGTHAKTLELFDQRGIADELVPTGVAATGLRLPGRAAIDLSTLPTRFPFILVTPQLHVDALLERHAVESGAEVLRGVHVTAVEQNPDGILVRSNDATWSAQYVVAADGAHSTVRQLTGHDFPGNRVLESVVLADVRLDEPPSDAVTVDSSRHGFAFVAPFGDGRFRVIGWDRDHRQPATTPVTENEVRTTLTRTFGTDFGLCEVDWTSRSACDERQITSYRDGRIFFCGDAAHTHSPAGAQGMNTGIQDAANLGWKLVAVLDGADPSLLDTYDRERHPVGRLVLRTSGALMRAMVVENTAVRTLRTIALRALLALPPTAHRAAMTFSGLGISYPRTSSDPRSGQRAEDIPLTDGSRLHEALRRPGFTLVGHSDEIAERPTHSACVDRADPGPSFLVRPDGYVA